MPGIADKKKTFGDPVATLDNYAKTAMKPTFNPLELQLQQLRNYRKKQVIKK